VQWLQQHRLDGAHVLHLNPATEKFVVSEFCMKAVTTSKSNVYEYRHPET
jgi:hypothetical protein